MSSRREKISSLARDFDRYLKQLREEGIDSVASSGATSDGVEAPPKIRPEESRGEIAPSPAERTDARRRLRELEEKVKKCRRCRLAETRKNTVFGEGKIKKKVILIGEGPGENEDRQGRPFVGRAGKLLDKILASIGLNRDDVFITNIIKCRPPGNRDPKPDEVIACWPYLEEQIDLLQPRVIVTLGSPATKTLLDTSAGISRLRGRFHDYEGVPLMPTYHPAYLLRSYTLENRKKVWEDMKMLKNFLEGGKGN